MKSTPFAAFALLVLALAPACSRPAPADGSGSRPTGDGLRAQGRVLHIGPPAVAGVDGPIGVAALDTPVPAWLGGPASVRTTAEIMAQAARTPAVQLDVNRPRFRKAHPDRSHLPPNPESPADPVVPAFDRAGGPRVAQTIATPTVDVATLGDTGSLPPDTMGDIGPTQYLVGVNGRIRTVSKSTGAADGVLDADFETFFSSRLSLGVGTSDPRVRYDRRTGRWFVIMISVAVPNKFLVAVSSTSTISPATVWAQFDWTNTRTQAGVGGGASCLGDYPTLGVDEDALYIGVNQFCGANINVQLTFDSTSLYVLNKASLTGGTLSVVQFDGVLPSNAASGIYTPQGVDDFDANTNEGYFVGVDNAQSGTLVLRRVTNPSAAPSLSADIVVPVPATAFPIDVPHQGGAAPLDGLDDRLLQAVIRNGRLWTTHQIAVNASGAATVGGSRNAVRWYELANLATGPALAQSGTVFDSASSNPLSYFMGAVMPNGQGHVALGMTSAGAAARVNTAVTGRLASDPAGAMDPPSAYSANTSFAYNVQTGVANQRWGDYSYTSVDPDDDMTLWTLQQYVNGTDSYAVRLTRLLAPPPATIAGVTPSTVAAGVIGATVTVTGAATGGRGFFDPGPGFARRLAASFSGTGVTVTNAVVTGPTSITLTVNTVGAPVGARTLTVTNPDGQTATLTVALTIGTGVNQPPVFAGLPGTLAVFDAGSGASFGPVPFTLTDPEAAPVSLTVASSNTAVVPVANVVVAGTGVDRALTVLSRGALGSSTITLTASDGVLTATATVVVTVSASAMPGPPQALTATVVRNAVTFAWQAPASAASEPVSGYHLEAGVAPGQTQGVLTLGNVLSTALAAPSGVFYVRMRATTAAGVGPVSNEVQIATGEAVPPLAPLALLATVQGTAVSLQWSENPFGPVIAGYQLQAGTAPGLANLGVLPLPATARTLAVDAAPGTYYVRVVAVNAAGASVASNEAVIVPGPGTCTVPAVPTGLAAVGLPRSLSVRWNAPASGAIPTTYVLQAGTTAGAINLGTVALAATTTAVSGAVPAGPYFLRLVAANACGGSAASPDVSTVVP